jgi:hypothetical protein
MTVLGVGKMVPSVPFAPYGFLKNRAFYRFREPGMGIFLESKGGLKSEKTHTVV